MHLLLSIPQGAEWFILIFFAILFVGVPVVLLRRFLRNRELRRELDQSNRERDELKNDII